MADVKDNKDKVKNPWKKNKKLKKEKMCKKRLSKTKKKACLEAKKANNNEEVGDDKDTSLFAPTVAIFLVFLLPLLPP